MQHGIPRPISEQPWQARELGDLHYVLTAQGQDGAPLHLMPGSNFPPHPTTPAVEAVKGAVEVLLPVLDGSTPDVSIKLRPREPVENLVMRQVARSLGELGLGRVRRASRIRGARKALADAHQVVMYDRLYNRD